MLLISIVAVIVAVALLMLYYTLLYCNPYQASVDKLISDFRDTLHFGAYIDVYDLTVRDRVERLFVIRPENIVLYNSAGELFYYLESSSSFCPKEFAVVKFNYDNIKSINETGLFSVVCTKINSLTILEHFVTVKQNVSDTKILLQVNQIHYSVLDIINLLIHLGYVQII